MMLSNRARALLIVAVASVVSAGSAYAQTAYFSTQGSFTATAATQDFYFDLARAVTTADTFRFETFSSRGTTLNAAGDTSPISVTGFDSVLQLNSPGGVMIAENDDGAAGSNRDALLTWPGLADEGGNLGAGPLAAGNDYRIRLREFDNETGPWGVDLVGPANAMVFRDFFPDAGASAASNVRSIKFGTNGLAAVGSAEAHAIFKPTVVNSSNYFLTGDLVVAQTGNASFVMDSNDGDRFNIAGTTLVKVGGDMTLSGNAIVNSAGTFTVDGGRVAVSNSARIQLGTSADLAINSGGRVDVNAGATLAGGDTLIVLGQGGSATENALVVNDGVALTRGAYVGDNAGRTGRVTVTGANARWTLGQDVYVGNRGTGFVDITAGGQVSTRDGYIAADNGGIGTATVSGTGSVWQSTRNLSLGTAGSTGLGTLTVSNSGRLFVGDNGAASTPNGYSNIDDASANASDGGLLTIRNGGTLNVNTSGLSVGQVGGRSGKLVVTGAGSAANLTNALFIGVNGSGVLDVNAGGHVTAVESYVGLNSGGVGAATVSGPGSAWTSTSRLQLGDSFASGVGTLTISSNARLNVGDGAAAYNFPDYSVVDDVSVSASDGGLLSVYSGSTLTNNTTGLEVGFFGGHSGRVLVSGTGSTLNAGAYAYFGNFGSAVLDVFAGGAFIANTDLTLGFNASGRGAATVDGTNSRLTSRGNVIVGNPTGGNTTPSSITLANGGTLIVGDTAGPVAGGIDITDADPIANNAGGLLNIRNGGTVTAPGIVLIGNGNTRSGRLLVTGNGSTLSGSIVFVGNRGTGDARFEAGGDLVAGQLVVGAEDTGIGGLSVTGAGSTAAAPFADIGTGGVGKLLVADGGSVTVANDMKLGIRSTGFGAAGLASNGLLEVKHDMIVGVLGFAEVQIQGSTNGRLRVGDGPSLAANASVDVGDADLSGNNGGNLRLANASQFEVDADVVVADAANRFGRIAVASGSSFETTTQLIVGREGIGRVEVTGGGIVTAGTLRLGGLSGGLGVATITGAGSRLVATDAVVGSLSTSNSVGRVEISGGGLFRSGSLSIVTNSKVAIGAGGTLEITTTALTFDAVRGAIAIGYAGGTWTGNGVTSSAFAADPRQRLGYFAIPAPDTGIRIYNTLGGDANGDFTVTFQDLVALAQNYNGTGRFWINGDFNYDGAVNFPDLVVLAQNYNQSLSVAEIVTLNEDFGSAFAADWAIAQSLVPEPTTLLTLPSLLASGLIRRRR